MYSSTIGQIQSAIPLQITSASMAMVESILDLGYDLWPRTLELLTLTLSLYWPEATQQETVSRIIPTQKFQRKIPTQKIDLTWEMACLWKTHQTTSILNISDIERSQQSSVLPDHAKSLSSHQKNRKPKKEITKRNYLMIYLFLFAFVLHQVCLRGSRRKPDRVIYSPCCVISYCILFCTLPSFESM